MKRRIQSMMSVVVLMLSWDCLLAQQPGDEVMATVGQVRQELEKNQDNHARRLMLARFLHGFGEVKEAMKFCEGITIEAQNSSLRWRARFEMFLMRSELGDGQAAKKVLLKELKTPPPANEKYDPWMLKIGNYLVGKMEEEEFAKRSLPKLQDPLFHDTHYYMGMKMWIEGDRDGAFAQFRNAMEVSKESSATYQAAKLRLEIDETGKPLLEP
ncbi:hypothetical protein FEM03_20770 [Phragmitibacter flavus]|uniref:Tetratricopeptide repeat protein n=1 Tax=Phragmitibacter flavus TaxID=2576071 RepID=A0A5R8K904_9BACT|nr:hypothetical protein [Phragmitibacter flavus]TLD68770.1 hypothetical protein FEM03_20770 [Phragmitibacter flavus]